MRDLSLHILDLAQNSVRAEAKLVSLSVLLDEKGMLSIIIEDDGSGMSEELLSRVQSPFATTRTTRKVGLGIPMMAENCRLAGGNLSLESTLGKGTKLTATMDTKSIDCLPLGDLAGTVTTLVSANPEKPDFLLHCQSPRGEMQFDTREIRAALQGVSLGEPEIAAWMMESLQEEIQPIFGGVTL
ncbi:MAG: sensor histidine kinase [Clostridiales bacterium]|nr:sensor histidine kinase [Clostridiales bacterium]